MKKLIKRLISQERVNNFLHLPKTILANILYGFPTRRLIVIGVTGTDGKTTTTNMIYQILRGAGKKVSMVSSINAIMGGKEYDTGFHVSSPDPLTVQKFAKEAVSNKDQYLVLEVTSHALDQYRFWGINFEVGVITNITHDHLDYHKNFENYFGAKKKFFKILPKNAFALSNTDDEYGKKMLVGIQAKKYTYGFKNEADFSEKLETKLIGDFNVYNVLAVYASLVLLGMNKEKIKEQLKNVLPPKGRFDYFKSPSGVTVIVDYAHTPDALQNVLKTVQGIKTHSTSRGQAS